MEGMGKWIAGAVIGLIGVLGLFLAAHAHDDALYYAGLAVFVLAVLIIGAMVKRNFDMQEGAHS